MIGVNLSGAEFGTGKTHDVNYHYPTASEIAYYKNEGATLIRLPFTWERMQPTLGGALSTSELGLLKRVLSDAASLGVSVIIDLHNYGRYNGNTIGSDRVSNAQFADFWAKLAGALVGTPNLVGLDIMNEPHDMGGAGRWKSAAQAAVDAIRTVDKSTAIYVEGDNWSTASTWMNGNADLIMRDPSNNIVYEAHEYFDRHSQGFYNGSYDSEGAYANIGVDRLAPFAKWLKDNGLKGFMGEFGVPSNDSRWIEVQKRFVEALNAEGISGTAWGAGFWWPSDYPLRLGNSNGMTTNLAALQQYMGGSFAAPTPAPAPTPDSVAGVNDTHGDDTSPETAGVDGTAGQNGNDRLMGSAGDDRLDGGTGTDLADYSKSSWVDVDLTRTAQHGGEADGDTLVSIEDIVGTDQNDRLAGDAGANQLFGGGGADDLNGRGGADLLDGSWWIDTANYQDSDAAVNVDLLRATQIGGHAEGDILRDIENLAGSNHGDTLSGDGGANAISGQAGNDVIEGRGGSDVLSGGQGNDRFVFNSAADIAGDRVTDFGQGDLIDLRDIDANVHASGNQGFAFLGFGQFTGVAGQLHQVWGSDGTYYLQGDTNGDRVADFSIELNGNHEFRPADILL